MFPPNIEKEELNTLPLGHFPGEIHMVDSAAGVRKAMRYLTREAVLGFDTETRPSFKKGRQNQTSILQLSTNFHAVLIRIASVGLTDEVIRLLEDREIIKVGVAVHDDIIDLQRVRSFSPGGFIDLQDYVTAFGIESKGLSKLAGIVLGFRISKSQQVSNWESRPLTAAQKLYAATDAWVPFRIYHELKGRV